MFECAAHIQRWVVISSIYSSRPMCVEVSNLEYMGPLFRSLSKITLSIRVQGFASCRPCVQQPTLPQRSDFIRSHKIYLVCELLEQSIQYLFPYFLKILTLYWISVVSIFS